METSGRSDKGENRCYFPKRYILTALTFMGLFCLFAMRACLSVTIIAMVNRTETVSSNNSNFEVACPNLISESKESQVKESIGPKYNWDPHKQGLIIGAFYYGNIISQLPAGLLSQKIGAKWVLGVCVLNTAIFSLLTPLITSWSVTAFIIVRVIIGFVEGGTFPAVNCLISQWSPKSERSRLSAIICTGCVIGEMFSMAISGWLSSIELLGGWPSTYYLFGTMSCTWFILWAVFVHGTPSEHPTISSKELQYILETYNRPLHDQPPMPWKAIFSSLPMWSLMVSHFASDMGLLLLAAYLPTYLSTILHFDIHDVGLLSALPFIIETLCAWITSYLADRLRIANKLSITNIRKIFNSIGLLGPGLCLLIITVSGCRPYLIVSLVILAMGLMSFVLSGFNVTHVDMSPTFAGTMYAITNTIGSTTGFIGPAIVGFFTSKGATIENWNSVFYIITGIYAFAATFFAIFASAELQPWETEKEESKHNSNIK